jgi:transposase
LKKGGFLAHRSLSRSEDETEIRAGEGTGGKSRERHPTGGTPAILGRREEIRIVLEGLCGE